MVAKGGCAVQESSAQRLILILLASFFAFLLGACNQPVFEGLPTPTPDEVVLVPSQGAPRPPFGPYANVPDGPIAGDAPAVATVLTSVLTSALTTTVPSGPAFAWHETENYLILGT